MWRNNGLSRNTDLAQISGSNHAAVVPEPQRKAAGRQPDLLEFTINLLSNPCHLIAAWGTRGILHLHLWAHSIHSMNLTQEQLELLNYPGSHHRKIPDLLYGLLYTLQIILIWFRYTEKGKLSFRCFSFSRVSAFSDSRGARIRRQKKDTFSPVFFFQLTQKKGAPQFRTQEPFIEDFRFTACDSDTSGETANWANPNSTRTTQDFSLSYVILSPTCCNYCLKASNSSGKIALGLGPCFVEEQKLGQDRGSHMNFYWLIIWPQKSKVKI